MYIILSMMPKKRITLQCGKILNLQLSHMLVLTYDLKINGARHTWTTERLINTQHTGDCETPYHIEEITTIVMEHKLFSPINVSWETKDNDMQANHDNYRQLWLLTVAAIKPPRTVVITRQHARLLYLRWGAETCVVCYNVLGSTA